MSDDYQDTIPSGLSEAFSELRVRVRLLEKGQREQATTLAEQNATLARQDEKLEKILSTVTTVAELQTAGKWAKKLFIGVGALAGAGVTLAGAWQKILPHIIGNLPPGK